MGSRKVRATCHACGHAPSVPADLAGKRIRCPRCDEPIRVPEDLSGSDTSPIAVPRARDETSGRDRAKPRDETSGRDRAKPRDEASGRDGTQRRTKPETRAAAEPEPAPATPAVQVERPSNPAWSVRVWVLVLLLLPLIASSVLWRERPGFVERVKETASHASPEVQFRVKRLLEDEATTRDDLLAALPEPRLDGALLTRDTQVHWALALATAAAFLAAAPLVFRRGSEARFELLTIAFYTSTAGILILFGVQRLAFASPSWRSSNPLVLLVKFIALSYALAEGQDDNILTSMIGFTCGVGLCEELTKALPLVLHVTKKRELAWRKACLWGLASGVGFGVAEGVIYSGRYYNGIEGAGIYAVRFLSCVGLHALWAAAGCISISLDQKRIAQAASFKVLFLVIVRALAAPILLHGFYDTLLKKERFLLATLCAVGSFGWLVSEIDRAWKQEVEVAEA